MTDNNRLTIEQLTLYVTCADRTGFSNDAIQIACQLLATMQDNERLREALNWCAGHAYAGGKSFGDTPLVKKALQRYEVR